MELKDRPRATTWSRTKPKMSKSITDKVWQSSMEAIEKKDVRGAGKNGYYGEENDGWHARIPGENG